MPTTAEHDSLPEGFWLRRLSTSIAGSETLHTRVLDEIVESIRVIRGNAAAEAIRTQGVGLLHSVLDARQVGQLREHVIENLRNPLLDMAVALGRGVLNWRDDFYVDDYVILRVNFPYEVARLADPMAENPGMGEVSPWMRDVAKTRRLIDPVYDPKGYHRNHPPAAWAHGPHVDSWAGHSKNGVNIWWAISDVPAEAGVVFYPQLTGRTLPCDRRTLYLRAGYPLPKPIVVPLLAGELMLFDPEILHGTHLNLTERTRVAISLRLNAKKPTFDPHCFYAREFWRRASDIESARYLKVLHFKREDNLAAVAPAPESDCPPPATVLEVRVDPEAPRTAVGASALVGEGMRLAVRLAGRKLLILRIHGRLRGIDTSCPHYGVDLADGAADHTMIFCPACGISFDLNSGKSLAPSLTLRLYEVEEENGVIFLRWPRCQGSGPSPACRARRVGPQR
jgi:nitrite reductase/ring-hydroxylating ferredoxin subunit